MPGHARINRSTRILEIVVMKEPSRGLRGATCVPGSIHRSALARALVLCVIACSVRSCVADESVSRALLGRAKEISEWIVGVRRGLHQVPEILFDLPKTSAYVRNTLDELGIKYR